jgi:phosphoglucosamine mutase
MDILSVPQQAARHLFGTDGIRGVAGEFPLDQRTTFAVGRALGLYLARQHASLHVVIGMDTRESGPQITETVAAGLGSAGATAESAGVITTPGVAYLARTRDFAAGIVISASHNPWRDNGIKIFGHDGFKLSDAAEMEIESIIFNELNGGATPPPIIAPLHHDSSLDHDYAEWLLTHVKVRLGGIRAVIDCANGAAVDLAPEIFDRAGLRAVFTHNQANGRNINEQCGALHPEVVAVEVKLRALDLGISFDGDADRVLFADSRGNVVNGDALLLLAAREMKARNALKGDLVVATTMSNMGLEAALKRDGIKMLRAPVGDKYVLEEMDKTGATLGGEQSGHILFRDGDATTGDGLLTALRILQLVTRSGKPLHELLGDFKVFPQTIENIRVREKKPLKEIPAVASAISEAERALDGNGRVVVRYSGTEKLARVMVEAESDVLVQKYANEISAAIRSSIGE